ncbi:CPCC family cysteine-rich protein [Psychroserpens mesophilus]|uniref:CPCC family cysteine-rich protein n=1 Tax=Psychroserpens mesophilus TaxID=325473 RepID=UPI0006949970|nr:CPCC family cysteine-rich protein [Psychroserpens mesophilus]
MERRQAIEKYARIKLTELSQKERDEQLEIMTLEHWSDVDEWNSLPESIQKEFEDGEEIQNPELEQYDAVLMIWLKHTLQSKTNEFLCQKLNIENIIGEPIELESCPCCGYRTIGERGNYEICKVCWWEDDGQDNKHSDEIMGGPNYGISLVMGRYNYLIYGLYDPKRTDLMEKKADEVEYKRGRIFEIIDNEFLVEKGTNWKWKINVA